MIERIKLIPIQSIDCKKKFVAVNDVVYDITELQKQIDEINKNMMMPEKPSEPINWR